MSPALETPLSRRSRISFRSWNDYFFLGAGILLAYFLTSKAISYSFISLESYLYLSLLFVALLYSFRRKKYIVLLGMGIGVLFALLLLIRLPQTSFGEYRGIIIEAKKNYFIFLSKGRRYYVSSPNHNYYFGDLLKISGVSYKFETTTYEGYFDFQKYLRDKGVFNELEIDEISSIFSLYPMRLVEKDFLAHFSDETASLIDASLFSFRDSKDSLFAFSASLGIYSELSNGGLLLSAFLRLFNPFIERRLSFRSGKILKLILIVPFLLLGPGKVGIWKLFLMTFSYAIFTSKEFCYHYRLILVSFIILLFDRWAILSSGFFYSFGLSFLFLITQRMVNKGRKEYVKKLRRKALLEAFLFPSSVTNKEIGILSPLLRTIFLPIILPFIILSFASFVSLPFSHLLEWYAKMIRKIIEYFSYAELAIPWVGLNSDAVKIILYLILFACLFFFDLGLHYFAYRLLKFTGLAVILNILPISNLLTKEVTFLNVGQGDSIILRDGLNTVMIDTGGVLSFDIAKEVDIPYLYKKRIFHLDYLILTHDDFDHSGGLESMLKRFDVNHLIIKPSSFPLTIGDIHLENLNVYGGEDNESSLVLYTDFINKKFLFMGDAGRETEKKILKDHPSLEVDILKVGHHGSNSSTSESFIRAYRPKEAVISVGKNNRYKHPSPEVLETLYIYGIKVRRTDEEGSITYWGNRFSSV